MKNKAKMENGKWKKDKVNRFVSYFILYPLSFILFVGFFCGSAHAGRMVVQSKEEMEGHFAQGNAYYEKGEYIKAAEEYGKVVSAGYASGPLYYNLGNAYFKSGDLGQAILNYKRAKRMMPRDADLAANYNYARTLISGNLPEEKGLWAWKPLRSYTGRFTVNELLLLSSILYVTIVLLLVILIYRSSLGHYIIPVVSVLIFIAVLNSVVAWRASRVIGKIAVVTAPDVESKFGPFDSATKFFTLYEGMEVKVLGYNDDWCKVKRSDGKVGWVKTGTIEVI